MVYTDLKQVPIDVHGVASSPLIKSTISGHLFDLHFIVEESSGGTTTRTDAALDNGTMVKILENTGNGLQERYAVIAGQKDKVVFVCSPPLIKDGNGTKDSELEVRFYHKPGQLAKGYEIAGDEYEHDVIAFGLHQITQGANLAKAGAYVTVKGDGGYICTASKPNVANFGFIGQIRYIQTGLYYSLVYVDVIQNKDVN